MPLALGFKLDVHIATGSRFYDRLVGLFTPFSQPPLPTNHIVSLPIAIPFIVPVIVSSSRKSIPSTKVYESSSIAGNIQ